jgi:hypothetical protein
MGSEATEYRWLFLYVWEYNLGTENFLTRGVMQSTIRRRTESEEVFREDETRSIRNTPYHENKEIV